VYGGCPAVIRKFCIHDNENINIAVIAGRSIRNGTEDDHHSRIEIADYTVNDLIDNGIIEQLITMAALF